MFFLVKGLNDAVADLTTLRMLCSVLLLDILVHLDELLLSLLLLVLFHELLEHLLSRLLTLLTDVLLDELVHAAEFLLVSGLAEVVARLVGLEAHSRLLPLAFAFTALSALLGPLISPRAIAINECLLNLAFKLRLVCFA